MSLEQRLSELSGLVFHREGARTRGVFVNELRKFTQISLVNELRKLYEFKPQTMRSML